MRHMIRKILFAKKDAIEGTPRKRSPTSFDLLPASGSAGFIDLTGNLSDDSSVDSYHCLVKKSNDLIKLTNENIARSEHILSSSSSPIPRVATTFEKLSSCYEGNQCIQTSHKRNFQSSTVNLEESFNLE